MAATGIPITLPALAASGTLAATYKVYSYVPDSSGAPTATTRALYTDPQATVAAANPVTLGASSRKLYRKASESVVVVIKSADDSVTYDTIHHPAGDGGTDVQGLVLSKADLKALPRPTGSVVYFMAYRTTPGDRAAGDFYWSSSNNATNVTNDPLECIYVAPDSDPTGASGAWVRNAPGNHIDAAWGGVRGNSGASNNTPTQYDNLETVADYTNRRTILFNEYEYKWSDTIVRRKSYIHLQGAGPNVCAFNYNHTNNGMQIGSGADYCQYGSMSGIRPKQSSGTAYAYHYLCGRDFRMDNFDNNASVRNLMKVGENAATITGAADNGSGLIRITVSSAQDWQTGIRAAIDFVDGNTELEGKVNGGVFILTRISSTVFDLQSSVWGTSTYTSGGRMGLFLTGLELESKRGDGIYIADNYFLDVYSIAGSIDCVGTMKPEKTASYGAGAALNFRKNTSCFDTCDFVRFENFFPRRFGAAVKVDNTRVVSVRATEFMADECSIGFDLDFSDATANSNGMEEVAIVNLRGGLDPNVMTGKMFQVRATAASLREVTIGSVNWTAYDTALDLEGDTAGSSGIADFMIAKGVIELRAPSATTKDAIRIAGTVYADLEGLQIRAQGAGTERNGVSIESTARGVISVRGIQMTGFSGHVVALASGITKANLQFLARDLINVTTPANRISNPDNVGYVEPGPPLSGVATYDPISLADGEGATTTVTVTGAVVGNRAGASFSTPLQGILMTSWVSASNTVSVRLQNETTGTIDLASGTLTAFAWPS